MTGVEVAPGDQWNPIALVLGEIEPGNGHAQAPAVDLVLLIELNEAPSLADAWNAFQPPVQRARHFGQFGEWPSPVTLRNPDVSADVVDDEQRLVNNTTIEADHSDGRGEQRAHSNRRQKEAQHVVADVGPGEVHFASLALIGCSQ